MNGILYGAMVTMCSTTWAGISQLGAIVPLELYPYKYHMQGDFPS